MLDVLLKLAAELDKKIKSEARSEVKERRELAFPFGRISANVSPYNTSATDYRAAYEEAVAELTAANVELEAAGVPPRSIPVPVEKQVPACRVNFTATLREDQQSVVERTVIFLAASLLSFGVEDEKLQDWGVAQHLRQVAAHLIAYKRRGRALTPASS